MMKNEQDNLLTAKEMLQSAEEKYREYITFPLKNSKDNTLEISGDNREIILELIVNLKWALLFGEGDAAYYLAEFYYKGWLFEKDNNKGDFIILIGRKLGSHKCLGVDYKGNDTLNFENLASKCVINIRDNKKIYEIDANTKINSTIKQLAETSINNILEEGMEKIFNLPSEYNYTVSAPLQAYQNINEVETPMLGGNVDEAKDNTNKCIINCLII